MSYSAADCSRAVTACCTTWCSAQASRHSTRPGRRSTRSCGYAVSFVPAEVRVFADPDELGAALADDVLDRYDAVAGPYLLGCPGGRSLRNTYRALGERGRTLDRLVVV